MIGQELNALDRVNARLLLADREDFTLIERLLAERGRLIELVQHAPLNHMVRREPALLEHLTAAIEAGAELERRLLLVRASLQAELRDSSREAHLARSLGALYGKTAQGKLKVTG